MGVTFSQFFPPAPTLTESNLPNQQGKVFIVTGGTSGVGLELCRILYQAGGTVYVTGRSKQKGEVAISHIKSLVPASANAGVLHFLQLSLEDLPSIKPAVDQFTSREKRLDVLFNNAGVSNPLKGSITSQGHDLTLATNCLGPSLLTQLLLPTLRATARKLPPGAVRVIWTSSVVLDIGPPSLESFRPQSLADAVQNEPQANYLLSKAGNWFLAAALAEDEGKHGILSVVQNPGNLNTHITRHFSRLFQIIVLPLLHPPVMGAYTELWAGLSPDLQIQDGGSYVIPWGRKHPEPREELVRALKSEEKGGSGDAFRFADWCEKQTERFKV